MKVAHNPPPAPTSWVAHSRRRRIVDNFQQQARVNPKTNQPEPMPSRPVRHN